MVKPTRSDLQNESTFFNLIKNGQRYNTATGARSTASISGSQTYAATTHTVADILQGNLLGVNPQDQMLVLNKALTDSLEGIYRTSENVHGFSTFTNTVPSVSNGSGSGANGEYGSVGPEGIGATVEETWVLKLPVVHSGGGLIWMRQGKGSREMHLPVAETLEEDVAKHKQYDGLKDIHKHPWNMDRVNGPIGGGTKIYQNVSDAETILGEPANYPGQISGAFPLLSPEEEQFYISMAWPYKGDAPERFRIAGRDDIALIAEGLNKNEHYRGKKILVFSRDTKRAVVCTPGDWGPHPYYSNGTRLFGNIFGFCAGLSPDVHYALGTDHGAEIILGWMPDDTPLGPYGTTSSGGALPGGISAATGSTVSNTLEELKYAGNIVASHPNLRGDSFKNHLRAGFMSQTPNPANYIKIWFPEINRGFHFPSLLNYLWYIMEAGFVIHVDGIGYVHRNIVGGTRLSNHATGGALDIMGIGRGAPIFHGSAQWRAENDALWTMLANLPRDTKPDEAGSSFAFEYGWYKVYQDPNPNHVHLGFGPNQIGQLIPALLPKKIGIRSTNTTTTTTTRAV